MREVPEEVAEVLLWIELDVGPVFPMFLRERMEEAGIEDHDVLYGEFVHAGYRLSHPQFIATCNAKCDELSPTFAKGVMDVLGLRSCEWRSAFAVAMAMGSVSKTEMGYLGEPLDE
jgi:hypothetical protein